MGKSVPLVGDIRTMAEARAIFTRVDGARPFALPMPTFLFRRFVSEDLVLMWLWLAEHAMDGEVAGTRALVPAVKDMETWLRERRKR